MSNKVRFDNFTDFINRRPLLIGLIITKIELTEIEDLFYIFGLLGNNF